ncbi:hypothetical protein CDL15_Pgr007228 [Punica granatum]|uniref:RNase H type-1 domain-containing protein n=1 Tax=Punica granatum TaxID=22663 RepID=A0A218X8C0_PUNGR|nr:hypothetical protein CDL15_Pgr007228 [Punica granatum]
MKSHNRLKIYLWRYVNECLPWSTQSGNHCPLYRTSSDDFAHLYGSCIFCQVAWRESPWRLLDSSLPNTSPKDIVNFIICPPTQLIRNYTEQSSFTLFGALVIYMLWSQRNESLFAGKEVDLPRTLHHLQRSFKEHTEPMTMSSSNLFHDPPPQPKPPDHGWIKINSDAAWSSCRSCVAGVAQSSDNDIIQSWSSTVHAPSPLQAEVHVVLTALPVALDNGWPRIWIEADAKGNGEHPTGSRSPNKRKTQRLHI